MGGQTDKVSYIAYVKFSLEIRKRNHETFKISTETLTLTKEH